MRNLLILSVLLFFQILTISKAQACTAFCLCTKDKVVVGKSYDWFVGHDHGGVYTNARGCQRTALNLDESPNPAKWISKYGSVTFTQFGRGFPIGGMNEKGLVVELLQLNEAEYNSHQVELPFVNEAQWSQYQLDNYASVDEVVANINKLRVVQAYTGIHYFVADASGKAATVEFLNGKAVVHHGEKLVWPNLTNSTYEESVRYVNENPENEIPSPLWNRTSERRFQTTAAMVEKAALIAPSQLLPLSWDILFSVKTYVTLKPAQWHIVYDITTGDIRFYALKDAQIKTFNIKNFDFSYKPGKVLNMQVELDSEAAGEVNVESLFVDYTDQFNEEVINANRFIIGPTKRNAAIAHGQQECR